MTSSSFSRMRCQTVHAGQGSHFHENSDLLFKLRAWNFSYSAREIVVTISAPFAWKSFELFINILYHICIEKYSV